MPRVMFPAVLAKLTEKQKELIIPGKTLREVLSSIIETYPSFKNYFFDKNGNVTDFINFYLNGQDVRFLEKEQTPVTQDDIISIVPAISGG